MSAQRMLFRTISIMIFLGIWLSGYDKVHWLLYIPAVFLMFAGLTGICPGLLILRRIGFK